MGKVIALKSKGGNSNVDIVNILRHANVKITLIDLRLLRKAAFSDPSIFVYNYILNHLQNVGESAKISAILLDKFDLWPIPKESPEDPKKARDVPNSCFFKDAINEIKFEPDIERKVAKAEVNWVYKLLHLIRFSLLYHVNDQLNHDLVVIGIYGRFEFTSGFYGDVFEETLDIFDLPKFPLFQPLEIKINEDLNAATKQRLKELNDVSKNLDLISGNDASEVNQSASIYEWKALIGKRYDTTQVEIPFDVDGDAVELSQVNLICGCESSGKTMLLLALVKYWRNSHLKLQSNAASATQEGFWPLVLKLDYSHIISQFVGAGEEYIRNIFSRAKACSPSLVYIDDLDLLLDFLDAEDGDDDTSGSQKCVTLFKTLLSELHNIGEHTVFIGCISGSSSCDDLPTELIAPKMRMCSNCCFGLLMQMGFLHQDVYHYNSSGRQHRGFTRNVLPPITEITNPQTVLRETQSLLDSFPKEQPPSLYPKPPWKTSAAATMNSTAGEAITAPLTSQQVPNVKKPILKALASRAFRNLKHNSGNDKGIKIGNRPKSVRKPKPKLGPGHPYIIRIGIRIAQHDLKTRANVARKHILKGIPVEFRILESNPEECTYAAKGIFISLLEMLQDVAKFAGTVQVAKDHILQRFSPLPEIAAQAKQQQQQQQLDASQRENIKPPPWRGYDDETSDYEHQGEKVQELPRKAQVANRNITAAVKSPIVNTKPPSPVARKVPAVESARPGKSPLSEIFNRNVAGGVQKYITLGKSGDDSSSTASISASQRWMVKHEASATGTSKATKKTVVPTATSPVDTVKTASVGAINTVKLRDESNRWRTLYSH